MRQHQLAPIQPLALLEVLKEFASVFLLGAALVQKHRACVQAPQTYSAAPITPVQLLKAQVNAFKPVLAKESHIQDIVLDLPIYNVA